MEKILYFKGKPENIVLCLIIIRKYQTEPNNRELVEKEIINSIYGKISPVRLSNLIYGRIRPPLITLGLLEDYKDRYELTALGKVIINHIKEDDYDFGKKSLKKVDLLKDFKRKIGKVLIDIDNKYNKVIEALNQLQQMQMEFVSVVALIIKLKNMGINPCQKISKDDVGDYLYKKLEENGLTDKKFAEGTRLDELLRYYDYFDLVVYRKKEVSLNKVKIASLKDVKLFRDIREISQEEFFNSLYKSYNKLIKDKIGPYVIIIPNIQKLVAYDLELSPESVIEKLKTFPSTFKNKQILLAPSREAQQSNNVIIKGRVRFYYIAIFNKGVK